MTMHTNTQNSISQSLNLKKKSLSLLTKSIAKILLKFRLNRNEFVNSLDESMVIEAKKQDPNASNVTIAIRTGIDRRYISKHLKGEAPQAKPDKMAIILEDIRWTAHKFYNSTKIPKTGPFRTFQSICEQRASGTLTYKAILEELINNDNLKDLGNKVELINDTTKTQKDDINYSQITATQINRVVNTIVSNYDIAEPENRLVQRTIYSTQINPINFQALHQEIKHKTNIYITDISELIVSYEEDVNVGNHPEYGISFLEYKIED